MTEDEVRDQARDILGLKNKEGVKAGVGQLKTFNQLGFKGISDKPDGWYLPDNQSEVALILETKASYIPLEEKQVNELLKNIKIAETKYVKVVGILYNAEDIIVFLNEEQIESPKELQRVEYYLTLFDVDEIDKEHIYEVTARINNCLRSEFGIKNLYHRMIFTACALVAERYGAKLFRLKDLGYETFHTAIHSTLAKSLEKSRNQNAKIDILLEEYSTIRMNSTDNQGAINNFIDWVVDISDCINSNEWHGEDVMGIFFNEFNRYKTKADQGQVFTPEHITDFMYRILDVNKDDCILDAACGSGGFLVKAMANMIQASGGANTAKAMHIKQHQLFGIEFDLEIYALACANMLIHKDGKTNLEQMDSRTEKACSWIASQPITKVMMNPPFENKFGCMKIVENVLDNVPTHTMCGFILPDKKLEKASKVQMKRILKNHRLKKIIKLPEKLFPKENVVTSIFVFEAGVGQKDREVFACYMEEDGLITVKNKGRHDVKGIWGDIEDYWVDIVEKQSGDKTCQWIKPSEHLSYQMPQKPFEIFEEDFRKTAMDYLMFQRDIDVKEFGERLLNNALYANEDSFMPFALRKTRDKSSYPQQVNTKRNVIDTSNWKGFIIGDLFDIHPTKAYKKTNAELYLVDGDSPVLANSSFNNGIGGYVDLDTTEDGGVITFSDTTTGTNTMFFQAKPFIGYPHVQGMYPIGEIVLNEMVALFLVSAMRASITSRFDFVNKFTRDIVSQSKVLLPVNKDGSPDWEYMKSYMQKMMLESEYRLDKLQEFIG